MNLRRIYHQLAENYWFLPGAMTVLGIGGGLAAALLDAWLDVDRLFALLGLDRVSAEGARTILSTAAGSMITVAGVTFSITIAAIATVTSQFGSRVFSNFMDDRGSQVTLGIFLGTFSYCLVVLGWVRSGAEGHGEFVPQLALMGAMALVLLSVGALIYFIHHTADGLRIQNQLDAVGRQLRRTIRERFEAVPEDPPEPSEEPQWDPSLDVPGDIPGYVEEVDYAALVGLAKAAGSSLRVLASPGDFVMAGEPIVRRRDDRIEAAAVREAFHMASSRSGRQDFTYYLDQLVEIAVRALSPGINDPFTAGNAVDWLGDGLLLLSGRRLPARMLDDDEGTPRVFRPGLDFDDVVVGTLDQLRPYFAGDRNAALQLMDVLVCCARCIEGRRARLLADYARCFRDTAASKLGDGAIAVLDRRLESLERLESDPEDDNGTPRAG